MAIDFSKGSQQVSRAGTNILDFITANMQKEQQARSTDISAQATSDKADQLKTILSLARSGDPQAIAGAQRFAQDGSRDAFSTIKPIDPEQRELEDSAARFSKIGLPQDQIDFVRDIMTKAGLPGDKIKLGSPKKALRDERRARTSHIEQSQSLAKTKSEEVTKLNNQRIKNLKQGFLKSQAQTDKILQETITNGDSKKTAQQYITKTNSTIRALRGMIQEQGGVTIVPRSILDADGNAVENPEYTDIISTIETLSNNLKQVSDFVARRRQPIQTTAKDFLDKRSDAESFLNDRYDGVTDAHIEQAMENPEIQAEIQAWKQSRKLGSQ